MGKKIRTPTEDTLRVNVRALLDAFFDGKPGKFHAKHKKSVALSRIQGIRKDGACNIATLGRVASAFGLKPYQLLIPGLNVKSPQVAVSARLAKAIEHFKESEEEDETNRGGTEGAGAHSPSR